MAQKKYNLEILSPARDEILEIAQLCYALVGPESARKITAKIKDSLDHLRTHPLMGVMLRDKTLREMGYRMLICGNYICIYKQIGDTVYVYHISDGRSNYPRLFSDLPK